MKAPWAKTAGSSSLVPENSRASSPRANERAPGRPTGRSCCSGASARDLLGGRLRRRIAQAEPLAEEHVDAREKEGEQQDDRDGARAAAALRRHDALLDQNLAGVDLDLFVSDLRHKG